MTPEELERLAREAGADTGAVFNVDRAWLARFAALVRAQALEDAAQHITQISSDTYGVLLREHGEAADWLRALKEQP